MSSVCGTVPRTLFLLQCFLFPVSLLLHFNCSSGEMERNTARATVSAWLTAWLHWRPGTSEALLGGAVSLPDDYPIIGYILSPSSGRPLGSGRRSQLSRDKRTKSCSSGQPQPAAIGHNKMARLVYCGTFPCTLICRVVCLVYCLIDLCHSTVANIARLFRPLSLSLSPLLLGHPLEHVLQEGSFFSESDFQLEC